MYINFVNVSDVYPAKDRVIEMIAVSPPYVHVHSMPTVCMLVHST